MLLLPTWSIIHSRFWKAQVPYLARHFRVVTFDGRGSGRSDRPTGAPAYADDEYADDTVAVHGRHRHRAGDLVGLSCGATWGIHVAAAPSRHGCRAWSPSARRAASAIAQPERERSHWDGDHDTTEGWAKYNRRYWLEGDYDDFLRFFFGQMFAEPHSTKQIEDCVGWGHEIDPATLVRHHRRPAGLRGCRVPAGRGPVRPGALPASWSCTAARTASGPTPSGSGWPSSPAARSSPSRAAGTGPRPATRWSINRLIKDVRRPRAARPAGHADPLDPRPDRRPKRALYLSSPIGLGHARRDVAIAQELRRHHPDLQIDWLAQHPVTAVLEAAGERIHPASAWLASESAHIEDECAEHDLHAFQAIRRMDEILVNNFMVFHDVVESDHYDLVIGDEAWDVDYFLHENPELKRFAFAWMTDFVGWLPMPDGGDGGGRADRRLQRGDDRAACPVPAAARPLDLRRRPRRRRARRASVPGCPTIREWTERRVRLRRLRHRVRPAELADREALRAELGYRPDERVCVVTVGGSGVGRAAAAPRPRRRAHRAPPASTTCASWSLPGPRIDPAVVPPPARASRSGRYVPQLYRHLAACDIAVVQGGLTTCMELTANRRPFVYVPLRHHFEQNFHVRHRLDRYGAGRCLPYDELDPDSPRRGDRSRSSTGPVDYRPVETGGAARAAGLLAELF